ncbi:MAG: DUF4149 domain-containing protein [Ramlibacter sp.]|nr:DUF4149 domain-containing protein [Ramlibacter sp.]
MVQRLPVMLAALWWGSLTGVAFVVVPLLFAHLPSPAQAGGMAAKLFSAQTWVALACGLPMALILRKKPAAAPARWTSTAMFLIAAGVAFALLLEFAVAPRIVARENLRLWHSLGSAMLVAQWACAGATLWRLVSRAGSS